MSIKVKEIRIKFPEFEDRDKMGTTLKDMQDTIDSKHDLEKLTKVQHLKYANYEGVESVVRTIMPYRLGDLAYVLVDYDEKTSLFLGAQAFTFEDVEKL